jgi:hypothetical protein
MELRNPGQGILPVETIENQKERIHPKKGN